MRSAGMHPCLLRSKQLWKAVFFAAWMSFFSLFNYSYNKSLSAAGLNLAHLLKEISVFQSWMAPFRSLLQMMCFLFSLGLYSHFSLNYNRIHERVADSSEKRERGTIRLNGCLDQFSASALSQSSPKLNSGPYPTTEVLLAWINRDGECDSEEVRPSLAD